MMHNSLTHLLRHAVRSLKNARGFTLIETFVAVTILIAAIAGPLSIASKGIQAAKTAQDQAVAQYLGRDAVEYIRWIRDTNALSGNSGWLGYLAPCVSADGSFVCRLDSTQAPAANGNIVACNNACPALNYNTDSMLYTYDTASPLSRFTRSISVINPVCVGAVCNNSEATVIVSVSWTTGSLPHSITLREDIFKWQ